MGWMWTLRLALAALLRWLAGLSLRLSRAFRWAAERLTEGSDICTGLDTSQVDDKGAAND